MAEVRFENVTKRFGDTVAVSSLNLEIPDKEFLVLVGPSGCGKSTVLRLLSGLEELTEGNIYIGDALSTTSRRETATLPWYSNPMPSIHTCLSTVIWLLGWVCEGCLKLK